MIVVGTDDFTVYHAVVNELKGRDEPFTTIEPAEPVPPAASVVIAGPSDDLTTASDGPPVIRADPSDPDRAVEAAFARLRGDEGRTIVGVDPGDRPGIAVLVDDVVTSAYHVPLEDAVETINRAVDGAQNPVVRVGDGARLQGQRIVNGIEDVLVELVDETATTPSLGTGTRGMGDVLAAVNIARRSGEPIEERTVEPTEGELVGIQRRSRRRSPDNRAIDLDLARLVARGELSLEEALAEHRAG